MKNPDRKGITLRAVLSFGWPVLLIGALFLIRYGLDQQAPAGQRLYVQHCQNCHLEQGQGLRGIIPPLAGADYLRLHTDQLPCIIRQGQQGAIVVNGRTYNRPMPGNNTLTPAEITSLIQYIQGAWGNDLPKTSFQQVSQALETCPLPNP
ncbi:MAG: cytochrome c [Bacteroidia bacterium]|nr:cytochrome c [Bacteroidia bacterium]